MYTCSLYLTSFPYLPRSPSLARYFSVAGSTVPLFDLAQRLVVVHEPLCTLIDAHYMGAYGKCSIASNGHSCGGEYALYFIQRGIVAPEPFEIWEHNLLQRNGLETFSKMAPESLPCVVRSESY